MRRQYSTYLTGDRDSPSAEHDSYKLEALDGYKVAKVTSSLEFENVVTALGPRTNGYYLDWGAHKTTIEQSTGYMGRLIT
jgi:hypothetical protein